MPRAYFCLFAHCASPIIVGTKRQRNSMGQSSLGPCLARPLDHLPARHTIPNDEFVLVDPPLRVHCPYRIDCLPVRRSYTSFPSLFSGPPDACRQITKILVRCAKPVSVKFAWSDNFHTSLRKTSSSREQAYFRNPPLAVASACAALSRSPRWLWSIPGTYRDRNATM